MHIHTINSDGECSCYDIVEKLEKEEVGVCSITDHDVLINADEIKLFKNLEFYTGVEISSLACGKRIHLLGYDFDNSNVKLRNLLANIQEKRREYFVEMAEFIEKKYNIQIPKELVFQLLDTHHVIGKPHLVSLLYYLGYGTTNKEIYDKYFKGISTSVTYNQESSLVIDTVHQAGGLVILAHPFEYEKKYKLQLTPLLQELIPLGLDGIEVFHSSHSQEKIEEYYSETLKNNLIVSCGSDYHGTFTKPDVILGNCSKEKQKIKTISLVDELRRRKI